LITHSCWACAPICEKLTRAERDSIPWEELYGKLKWGAQKKRFDGQVGKKKMKSRWRLTGGITESGSKKKAHIVLFFGGKVRKSGKGQ